MDIAAEWASRHLGLVGAASVAVAALAILPLLPYGAVALVSGGAGFLLHVGIERDERAKLRCLNDDAQRTIGRLGRELREAKARPVAEAQTKAMLYVPAGTLPLHPVSDVDAEGGGPR